MWMTQETFFRMTQRQIDDLHALTRVVEREQATSQRLEIENTRLRADLDWFKLRLNAVERERQQLIQAAIGVKIPIPEFTPVMEDPSKALNQMPDFGLIGNDAPDNFDPTQELTPAPDYSGLPQRANN